MDIETILYGILPSLMALCLVVASIRTALRYRRLGQMLLTITLVLLCCYALVMLYRISVLDAWPTFIPHVIIGFCLVLLLGQRLLFHRERTARQGN